MGSRERGRGLIVVDSSAVVAMMLDEPGTAAMAARLAIEPAGSRIMSVANYVEAGTVLAGAWRCKPAFASARALARRRA